MRLDQLIKLQTAIAKKVKIQRMTGTVAYIAGVDAAIRDKALICCIGVFSFPSLDIIDEAYAMVFRSIPYVPGFLSFRELPVIIKTYKKLKRKPDLLLVDGQGIAHPRALGLASHVGVILRIPTIGCAKSHLFGDYTMPRTRKGSYTFVHDGRRKIGLFLRTRDDVKPLFVSPGHRVDFDDCRTYVLASATKYRIPEPLRYAHTMAREKAREFRLSRSLVVLRQSGSYRPMVSLNG